MPQLRKNKLGARKETTSGKTNKNLFKVGRTNLIDEALPKAKPPERNKPKTKRSPKSAATDPATTEHQPQRPAQPLGLDNHQGNINKDNIALTLRSVGHWPVFVKGGDPTQVM